MNRRIVTWVVTLLLLVSIAINQFFFTLVKQIYGDSKTASVFPTNSNHFREINRSLAVKIKPRIVLFGDSRIAQWKVFPNSENTEVINRGINGETTAQLRSRFEQDVLNLNPDIVVLEMGINDLTALGVLHDRKSEIVRQCTENISYMIDTLMSRGIRTILLTIIPPAQPDLFRWMVWSDDIPVQVRAINRSLLNNHPLPLLHVIDADAILRNENGEWRGQLSENTLHLNSLGYQYLNAAVIPFVRQ